MFWNPLLQSPDVDAVAQVLGCKGVPELVQEESAAVGASRTAIAVLGDALAAVELGAMRDLFDDFDVQAVGLPLLFENTGSESGALRLSFDARSCSISAPGIGTARSS